ncbi:MAG: hypothetical protein MR713_01980 [Firmicutes bacterium]|nr:hypothetical protein [Bacillota bacterium]
MQEVFENIIKGLEEKRYEAEKNMELSDVLSEVNSYGGMFDALDKAIEIINQTAAEYNNGWIPVRYHYITDEEREEGCISEDIVYWLDCKLPEDEEEILITRKWRDGYIVEHDMCMVDDGYCLDSGLDWIDVIAWQPLPKPYQPKKDRANCKNRHENGNCLAIGGFCTSVDDKYCKYQPKGE